MKDIEFNNPHRKKHFEFFRGMSNPHFNITAEVDISSLLPFLKENNLPTNITIAYLISRAANDIPEFRWRIREDKVVEHPFVNPSFTVSTEVADVFSFCTVPYEKDSTKFIEAALKQRDLMRTSPSFEDEENRDDFLFLSAFPWLNFTSVQHAMDLNPCDSIPRMTWGKFTAIGKKIVMPLSVQTHHAVVDGRHIGHFFKLFEELCCNPTQFL